MAAQCIVARESETKMDIPGQIPKSEATAYGDSLMEAMKWTDEAFCEVRSHR